MADHIKAKNLRKGMVIKHDGQVFVVMSTVHLTPGNLRGLVQSKLRNLVVGNQMDHRFRSDDMIERVVLNDLEMEFLYADGDDYHFMNTESYEQTHLHRDVLGDNVNYLIPNLKLRVLFHEGSPVSIELPMTVDMKIVETEPELKGATASSTRKPATTETGLVVQVPAFIGEGERIRVSTEDGAYQERAK